MLTQDLAIAQESCPLHERLMTTPTLRDALVELLGYEILITDAHGRVMRLDGTVVDKTKIRYVRDAGDPIRFDRKTRTQSQLLKVHDTRDAYDAALLDALRWNP